MTHLFIRRSAIPLAACVALLGFFGCSPSADRIGDAATHLADDLSKNEPGPVRLRVAVLPFVDESHQAGPLCETLRERVASALVGRGVFDVVDVVNLDNALAALRVQGVATDGINPTLMARLHDTIGAQAVVIGRVTDTQSDLNVRCGLVDTATGTDLASADQSISKSDLPGYAEPTGPQLDPALRPILAPIALYPDPLLADVLAASTYPGQVQAADAWLRANPYATDGWIAAQPWDSSVQAIVHYPAVIEYMAENMQWTQSLGSAVNVEQPQVMATIQQLRAEAVARGNLGTNAQETVVVEGDVVYVRPSSDVIFVPVYDPDVVYVRPYQTKYSDGYRDGPWIRHDMDWHDRRVYQGDWHQGWVRGQGGWARNPDLAGRTPGAAWRHDARFGPAPVVRQDSFVGPAPRVTLGQGDRGDGGRGTRPGPAPAGGGRRPANSPRVPAGGPGPRNPQ